MVAVHHVLWRDALLAGPDGDGHSVLVAAADEYHLALLQSEVTHVDVCRHVDAGQVANMYAAVGIGQRCGHRSTLEMFLFH